MKKTCSSREIIALLKADGWILARVKGDHHQFKHMHKRGTVTVQHPVKDLSGFIANSIFKQAGWKLSPEREKVCH